MSLSGFTEQEILVILKEAETVGQRGGRTSTEWMMADGLFFKKRRSEPKKSEQEYRAVEVARRLLPSELAPVPSWGVVKGWFVSERIEGPTLKERPSLADSQAAAQYLARLHAENLSDETRREFQEASMTHYSGPALRARIKQETEKGELAFPGSEGASRLLEAANEIIHV